MKITILFASLLMSLCCNAQRDSIQDNQRLLDTNLSDTNLLKEESTEGSSLMVTSDTNQDASIVEIDTNLSDTNLLKEESTEGSSLMVTSDTNQGTSAIIWNKQLTKKEKRGLELMELYDYQSAIEVFESIKSKSIYANRNLARCFEFVENYEQSEIYWKSVVKQDSSQASDLRQLYSVLMRNEKYVESWKYIKRHHILNKDDSRTSRLLNNENYINMILSDTLSYDVLSPNFNSNQQDFGVTYFGEQIVFASSRGSYSPVGRIWNWNELPYLDLYIADADSNGNVLNLKPFDNQINQKFHEGPAVFSDDLQTIYFTRSNYDGKDESDVVRLQLFIAVSQGEGWSDIISFPYNSDEYSVGHPSISSDGQKLYFSSDMPGGFGGSDIYVSTQKTHPLRGWGEPVNLGAIVNSEGNEMFPVLNEDGTLFYASDGLPGLGGLDIFEIKANEKNELIPLNLGASFNSSSDDFGLVFNSKLNRGFFSSNRPGGKGSDDIYFFNKREYPQKTYSIQGIVSDEDSIEISGALIHLYNEQKELIDSSYSDSMGVYEFHVQKPEIYTLSCSKETFIPIEAGVDLASNQISDTICQDIKLNHKSPKDLYFLVEDQKTGLPIAGVEMKLLEDEEYKLFTSIEGEALQNLPDKDFSDSTVFTLMLSKEGYFDKTVEFKVNFDLNNAVKVNEIIDLTMDRRVDDVAEMIQINPINFDLNSSQVRPDAAIELEKIISILNEYPEMIVELGSHTDCRGSAPYNQALSQRRAISSLEYIQKRITTPERVSGKGFGESMLKNNCSCEGDTKSECSDSEHAENRRTEFIIVQDKL